MVKSCSAYNCKERYKKGSGISFFSFPSDLKLRTQWILATKRKNFQPSNFSTLCSKHFIDSDIVHTFGRTKLREDSIPSIFNFPSTIANQDETVENKRLKLDIASTSFPFKRPKVLKSWIKAVGRENWTPTKSSKLCGEHFLPNDYKPGYSINLLKPEAVPSIFSHTKQLPEELSEDGGNEDDTSHTIKSEPIDIIEHTIKAEPLDELDQVLQKDLHVENNIEYVVKEEIPDEFENQQFSKNIVEPVINTDVPSTSIKKQGTDRQTQTHISTHDVIILRRKIKTLTQKLNRRDKTIAKLKKITKSFLNQFNDTKNLNETQKKELKDLKMEIEHGEDEINENEPSDTISS